MNYKYLPHDSIIQALQDELRRVRTGRISGAVVEGLKVEAYESYLSMVEVATISNPEPRTIVITPFDKNLLKPIAKSIEEAKIGVTPSDNGAGIILNFPPMTQENRQAQLKIVDEIQEHAKIQVRQNRQDILSREEKRLKAENASTDAISAFKDDLQAEVNSLNTEIENICKSKKEEVLKI